MMQFRYLLRRSEVFYNECAQIVSIMTAGLSFNDCFFVKLIYTLATLGQNRALYSCALWILGGRGEAFSICFSCVAILLPLLSGGGGTLE